MSSDSNYKNINTVLWENICKSYDNMYNWKKDPLISCYFYIKHN